MIKEHCASNFLIEAADWDFTTFDSKVGKGKMWELFEGEIEAPFCELIKILIG